MQNESNILLTIYTATYNRSNLLSRVYASLKAQTKKDFVWLIIDDGSIDSTRQIVQRWIKEEADFKIQYHYKSNGGIHTARDAAYRICNTELIFSCDSDDWLPNDAVEKIINAWKKRTDLNSIGIIGRCEYENGEKVTINFPHIASMPWQDLFYKYKCGGDTAWVFNTSIIKAVPDAPVFDGEKLIGESYKCMQLPSDIPVTLLDSCLSIIEYQEEGYTASAYNYMFNNPNGFRVNYKQFYKNGVYIKTRIKGYLGYIASSIYLRDSNFIKNSERPIQIVLLIPFGCLSLLFLMKRRTKMKPDSKKVH